MIKPIKQLARVLGAEGVDARDALDVDAYIRHLEEKLEETEKKLRGARGSLRDIRGDY